MGQVAASEPSGIDPYPETGVFAAHGQPVAPFSFDEPRAAPDCGSFPRLDAYLAPPIGLSGSESVVGTERGSGWGPGSCPATVTTDDGWTHCRLGA